MGPASPCCRLSDRPWPRSKSAPPQFNPDQGRARAARAADVDALAADALGWPLPVAGLREWLQGFATNVDGRRFIASAQNDSVNTRDGWRIRYVSWQDEPDRNGATITHPKRIDLARSTAQAGEVSMRIVIDSWQAR
ncbi:lipoprotein insertase outer membrane protein LolB [Undibacterium arcticum]